jgi:hypothetical protein
MSSVISAGESGSESRHDTSKSPPLLMEKLTFGVMNSIVGAWSPDTTGPITRCGLLLGHASENNATAIPTATIVVRSRLAGREEEDIDESPRWFTSFGRSGGDRSDARGGLLSASSGRFKTTLSGTA